MTTPKEGTARYTCLTCTFQPNDWSPCPAYGQVADLERQLADLQERYEQACYGRSEFHKERDQARDRLARLEAALASGHAIGLCERERGWSCKLEDDSEVGDYPTASAALLAAHEAAEGGGDE